MDGAMQMDLIIICGSLSGRRYSHETNNDLTERKGKEEEDHLCFIARNLPYRSLLNS